MTRKLNPIYLKIKPYLPTLIFFIFITYAIKGLTIYKHLASRPTSIHLWAQCMRASIAKNYAEESMNFFLPRLNNVMGGEGITGMEFPFVNYVVAILYKLFGFHEYFFRGFVLFTIILGLYCFFKLSNRILKNSLASIIVIGMAYFSPVLVYYSINFMPDVPSLGFVLMAWFVFYKYLETNKTKFIYWFFALATLAALIKITSLIVLGVITCILILDGLHFFKPKNNNLDLIEHKKKFSILIIVGILTVVAWYVYANWVTLHYKGDAFTLKTEHVTNIADFKLVAAEILKNWETHYYAPLFFKILFWLLVSFILFAKFLNRLLITITVFTILGSVAFVLFMFKQFMAHDYYIIPLITSVFFIMLTAMDMVMTLSKRFFVPFKYIVLAASFYFMFQFANYCKANYKDRMAPRNRQWYSGDYTTYYKLEPVLRKLGIKKDDITLSGSDFSFSNSLYLMNQKGYQFNGYDNKKWFDDVFKTINPKYMVLNDTVAFNKLYGNEFNNKIIGQYKRLMIYKLH